MYLKEKMSKATKPFYTLKLALSFPFAVLILEKPHDTVALEGETVTLVCTISDPEATVSWTRDSVAVKPGPKYDLRKAGASVQLRIHNLLPEDSGTFSCSTGDDSCDVSLTVEGKECGPANHIQDRDSRQEVLNRITSGWNDSFYFIPSFHHHPTPDYHRPQSPSSSTSHPPFCPPPCPLLSSSDARLCSIPPSDQVHPRSSRKS